MGIALYSDEERDVEPRCTDWLIACGDTHYAVNRSSFKTYHDLSNAGLDSKEIKGVGTVELQVQRSNDSPEIHTLVLENVAHIPGAICNAFCYLRNTHRAIWDIMTKGFEAGGMPSWYGERVGKFDVLVLAGNAQGESEFRKRVNEGDPYFTLSLYVSRDDRQKLGLTKRSSGI
ncbi:hypothetical protein LOZ53_000304 [Ophidiomyces ophidiicola]|nr:hypothetical protein LOZ55_001833 [Ophidiomyces ophidiicola]KAI1993804.1 hypothetical protein LOZ54_001311 [Ophidiomyces ophidiicola]KAI1997692.1 hypothetical protein LOZ53_000304 [Ophidiomyces ophidiicola]KAI1999584.1 hypothetical protein LOZ51_002077 [Ophidiomyces ophidiicola]